MSFIITAVVHCCFPSMRSIFVPSQSSYSFKALSRHYLISSSNVFVWGFFFFFFLGGGGRGEKVDSIYIYIDMRCHAKYKNATGNCLPTAFYLKRDKHNKTDKVVLI